MRFDFCLVASWSKKSHQQLVAWGSELERRGYRVAIVTPSTSDLLEGCDIRIFHLDDFEPKPAETPSGETVETRYDIPTLNHLSFTERLYFGLSRENVRSRAARIAVAFEELFSEHTFEYTFQVRGPEAHRLLAHHLTEHYGKTSIWAEFSPFEDTFALTTSLDGAWEGYETIPYEEIPEGEREDTRRHIEQFLEARRFYAHDNDAEDTEKKEPSRLRSVIETLVGVFQRERPGRLRDQAIEEATLKLNSRLNDRLLPSVEESRQICRDTEYVFLPLQYPIESRLTVFSPQFFDQSYLIEYVGRVIPASMQLLVKGHPNHPGRPSPNTIRRLREENEVTFLHNDTNAHEVIEHSEAVVVVNNTVGFETIYHQKPLIALGDPPYAETPAVRNVDSLDDLPEVLGENVSETVPEERLTESIYSLREASYPGDRFSYDDDSAQTLVGSILTFIGE